MSEPLHTLVQISDLHVDASAALYGRIDTIGSLRAALGVVAELDRRPDAVLLTGDLTHGATAEDYRCVRAQLEPAVHSLGTQLVVLPGNHDATPALREHLLGDTSSTGPMDAAVRVGGLRVIALDTTVAGSHHGELTDAQLAWLGAELADAAPHGTVLALHHPPLPSPIPLFAHVALSQPDRLGAAIAGTDVRMILSGHAHHTACGALGGVPVWVAPSTAYTADVTAPGSLYRGVAGGAGITRVDVFADAVVTTLVPLTGRDTVVELDLEAVLADL